MTNMNDMDERLVAYADGELDEAAAAEVEAYLAVTPAAQRTLAIYRDTAALLRAAFPAREDGGSILTPPIRRRRWRPYVWAAAACLAIGLVGYGAGAYWPGLIRSDRDHILSEIAQNHSIYSRETVHLVEVPASQTDHLKAWLGKRVNGTLV